MEHPPRDSDHVSLNSTHFKWLLSVLLDILRCHITCDSDNSHHELRRYYCAAPLFSRVTAALTTPQSGQDIRGMFENFVKEIHSMKSRK